MKKTFSIVTVALLMAGSVAYACSGCGCEAKKAEKSEKSDCSSCKGEKKETAYKPAETADMLACGGSKKDDDGKKSA